MTETAPVRASASRADPIAALLAGTPAALARAITAVENQTEQGRDILRAIEPKLGRALVVGFTGPPGAGKSTLVSAYIGALRQRDKTIGVIAIDPSSPISGGAILGDRIRMAAHDADPGVFIRSLASRGHLGGLSATAARVIDVMDAAGKDVVIVETVGAGQSEVDISEVADTTVVICAPGLGDDVQAIKAGILEVASVLVVNKSDLPLADRSKRQLKAMLQLRPDAARVPVLATTATTGDGVAELADTIARLAGDKRGLRHDESRTRARARRLLADSAAAIVRRRIRERSGLQIDALCDAIRRGEIDVESAARIWLEA